MGDKEELTKRTLAAEFIAAPEKMQETSDGGLLVRDVKLLAPGTWTDSMQKTPCRYTEKRLAEFATNWTDPSMWSRHPGGMPRDITEKVGEIRGPRYNGGAVQADIFYHGKTTRSKDTIAMVKAGLANYVSVEMRTHDTWIPEDKLFEADQIVFDGVATVNKGACTVCTIRSAEAAEIEGKHIDAPITPDQAATPPEVIQVIQKAQSMDETEKKELDARFKVLEEGISKQVKTLEDKIASKDKELEQTKAELEKLKNTPMPKTSAGQEKEMELPTRTVIVDRRAGTVSGAD